MKRSGIIAAIWLLVCGSLLAAGVGGGAEFAKRAEVQPDDKGTPAAPRKAAAAPRKNLAPAAKAAAAQPARGAAPSPTRTQPPSPGTRPPLRTPPQMQRDPMLGKLAQPSEFPPPDLPPPPGRRRPLAAWPGGPLPAFLFMLAEKPPEEQEKVLQSSPRFRAMSPMQQQEIRLSLRRVVAMTPQQRRLFKERFEIFHSLPVSARETIRTEIFPVWNRMAPPRRQLVLHEFRRLAPMRPAARERFFVQDTFIKQFSNDEQRLLRQMLTLAGPSETAKRQ